MQPLKKQRLKKIEKYANLLERFIFFPVAIETLGVFGEDARKFVMELGTRLQIKTGDPRSLSFLKQRISIAIQRGNAAAVFGTLPGGKGFGEIFYMSG